MNKGKWILSVVAGFALAGPCPAQTADATPSKAPPPNPLFSPRIPIAWVCMEQIARPGIEKLQNSEEAKSGHVRIAPYETRREIARSEGLVRVVRSFSNGQKESQYYVEGYALLENKQNRTEIHEIGPETWSEDFTTSQYPELDWINEESYRGIEKLRRGEECHVYELADSAYGTRRAYVRTGDLLPLAFDSPGLKIAYVYERGENAALALPPKLERAYQDLKGQGDKR